MMDRLYSINQVIEDCFRSNESITIIPAKD